MIAAPATIAAAAEVPPNPMLHPPRFVDAVRTELAHPQQSILPPIGAQVGARGSRPAGRMFAQLTRIAPESLNGGTAGTSRQLGGAGRNGFTADPGSDQTSRSSRGSAVHAGRPFPAASTTAMPSWVASSIRLKLAGLSSSGTC